MSKNPKSNGVKFNDEAIRICLKGIVDRLLFFPDREFLLQFDLGRRLVADAEAVGGIERVLHSLNPEGYFDQATVPIPSLDQQLAGTEIAYAGMEGEKRFEFSKPGTRKTIGVLAAIPVINEVYLPHIQGYRDGQRIKTLVCCPTYIVPTWLREARRLLVNPNISVITRENRGRALKKAAQEDTDLVVVGFSMSYKKAKSDEFDPEIQHERRCRNFELRLSMRDKEQAYAHLAQMMDAKEFERYKARSARDSLKKILQKITKEEIDRDALSVMGWLRQHVFRPDGHPYYMALDEIHNVVDPESVTAQALAQLYRSATWGAQVTGTGIRNNLKDLAYMAYLDGRIEDPREFPHVFRSDPRIMRCLIDLDANPMLQLSDVDGKIKNVQSHVVEYDLSSAEMDLHIALANSTIFDGKDQYLLLNYCLTNPQKLLPGNVKKTGKDDSLHEKVVRFFEQHPSFFESIPTIVPSKLKKTKEIVRAARESGRKVIVACEYSSQLTKYLERELAEFGCVRVDQHVSAELREWPLTEEEIAVLRFHGFNTADLRYRSDLPNEARAQLGISPHADYRPSQRHLALLDFRTDPAQTVLIATYGTLREGTDIQEATELIEYEPTTVPSRFWQMIARMHRSGQDEQVTIHQLRGKHTFEERKYGFRESKDRDIREVFENVTNAKELERLLQENGDKGRQAASCLPYNARAVVSLMLSPLTEGGLDMFLESMRTHSNAEFLAKNYNWDWDSSHSANCARLIRDIVIGLERSGVPAPASIIDEGCGPATVSRMLHRKTICLDVNKYQLNEGMDACEDRGIVGNEYYVGTFTNLESVIPWKDAPPVYDSQAAMDKRYSILDASQDLAVCSLALHYLVCEGRKQFFTENKRVLKNGGYLMLVLPPSKIDPSCREQFLKDINESGFTIDNRLTGEYASRRLLNIETGEESPGEFEAYVVVAQKADDALIHFEEGRMYYALQPLYRIQEGPSLTAAPKGNIFDATNRRYQCSGFYNKDTGVDPLNLSQQARPSMPIKSPAVPSEPTRPVVNGPKEVSPLDEFKTGVESISGDQFSALENALRKLAGLT